MYGYVLRIIQSNHQLKVILCNRSNAVGSDLLDNDNKTGVTLEKTGIHGENPYISIDLGENPCEIVNVQVTGWNPQKMGFFKVNSLI